MTKKSIWRDHSLWLTIALSALILVVWELLGRGSEAFAFLFSRPSQVLRALVSMALSGELLSDTAVTAAETLLGTAAGTILGSTVGLGLWLSKKVARIAAPFVIVAANFPIFALAPAAIVWLGIGMSMKVFLAAFATFFVSLHLSHQGAKVAVERFAGVFDGFRATRLDKYTKIIVPGAMDAVFNSMRVNVGLGILGAFIGEFIVSDQGLGRSIIRASGLYQIDRVLAASLCIIALAGLLDRLACGIQQERLIIARAFGLPRSLRNRSMTLSDRLNEGS